MKNIEGLKTGVIGVVIGAFTLAGSMASCNNPSKSEGTLEPITEQGTMINQQDAHFLNQAAMINLEEIQLGQLARQNGTIADVKELGKMIEDDHTQAQNDLSALARKKSITLPSTLDSNAQSDYKKLSAETGMGFDKGFCNMMVNGHKEAIALFEKESTQANDSAIRQWATTMLPALHKHLDASASCLEKCGK
jgi:putative membrane protein